MDNLTTRLAWVLNALRVAIDVHLRKENPRAPLFRQLHRRIGTIARLLLATFEKWKSGTLLPPRPSRAGQPRRSRAPTPRLPRRHCWVVAEIGYVAAGHASQLQHLLSEPEMVEFLTAVPRARRLLRPLCDSLGLTAAHAVPAILKLRPMPRTRSAPPQPPPTRGIIDPPEAAPSHLGWSRARSPFECPV